MIQFFKLYFTVLASYLILDAIWLNLARNFYKQFIPGFTLRLWPAVVVYLVASAGLVIFLGPKVADRALWQSFLYGAFLGLVVYGVYDFTNFATMEKWSLKLSVIDTLWGMIVFGVLGVVLAQTQAWFTK